MLGVPLPGDPEGFATAAQLAEFLDGFSRSHGLPVHEGVTVTGVAQIANGFSVTTTSPEFPRVDAAAVVVASGGQNHARLPAVSRSLPGHIHQVHAGQYRNPGSLPAGGVLVVGSAQSGCQIAEDLLGAGRNVFLSVSRVARARRRYRGRDILDWFDESGFLDQRPEDLPDPAMMRSPQPQISGVGRRGHTVSLPGLAGRGAVLVGRLVGADGAGLDFDQSVADCIRFADAGSAQIRGLVDEYITARGINAPPAEDEPADHDCPDPEALQGPTRVTGDQVAAVVWSTGFDGDFSWLRVPALDPGGHPIHRDGISATPGLFFVGLPWLRTRRSGIITGVDGDGAWIAGAVARHLGR
jgi:putative flavoprotein involved in K+ transport